MSHKRILFIFTVFIILLLSTVSIAQAAPPLQDGSQPGGDGSDGTSLGDTFDMDELGNNLGTVMSGKNGSDDTGDGTGDGTNDGMDGGTKDHPVASALAEFFSEKYEVEIGYNDIMDLHQAGNGFGNIAKAYFFAAELGLDIGDPNALSGFLGDAKDLGWGNVLKENGIHPGAVGKGHSREWPKKGDSPEEEDTLQGAGGPPGGGGPPGQLKKGNNPDGSSANPGGHIPPGQLKKGNNPDDSPELVGQGGGNKGNNGQGGGKDKDDRGNSGGNAGGKGNNGKGRGNNK